MKTKKCKRCELELPKESFNRCKKITDGLQTNCISCSRILNKEWRLKNKDRHDAYMKKYRENNRDICNERGKKYREKNLEKELLRSKNYKLNNPVIRQLSSNKRSASKVNSYHKDHDPKIEAVLIEMRLRLQKCLGIKFLLHKIIPMTKGGYHHHQNIQVIPKSLEAIANKLCKTDQPILKSWRDVPTFLHTRALDIEEVKMEMNDTKKCYSCCSVLPIENFYILNKKYKNRSSYCDKCSSENYKNYSLQYPEKRKQRQKNYCINNRNKVNLHSSKRRALKKNATHPDHDQNIEKTYVDMRIRLENCLGIKYNVDHILPLTKGGYHHHGNLQTIPESINDSKRANLKFRHPSLVHWTELPGFLLDRVPPQCHHLQ